MGFLFVCWLDWVLFIYFSPFCQVLARRSDGGPSREKLNLKIQQQMFEMLSRTLNKLVDKLEVKGIKKEEDPKYTVSIIYRSARIKTLKITKIMFN